MRISWQSVRSTFVVDGQKYYILKGRKQPRELFGKDLPDWQTWNVSFTIYNLRTNEIRRIRAFKISKRWRIEVVTKEFWRKKKEAPFVFRLVEKL